MTEQSSRALSNSGLDKLNLSPGFPLIGERGLGHSERAGEQHGQGWHLLTIVPTPHRSPDAECLHQSQRLKEKASDFTGRLGSHTCRGFRSHTLHFWCSSLQTPRQLHPEAAAHTSMERVVRVTQLLEEQEGVSVGRKGHCDWNSSWGASGAALTVVPGLT